MLQIDEWHKDHIIGAWLKGIIIEKWEIYLSFKVKII